MTPLRLHGSQKFLLNRMVIGIASKMRGLVESVAGEGVTEIGGPVELPGLDTGLIIVGRQQLRDDYTHRYGYEVLDDAISKGRPDVCLYVIPTMYKQHLYKRDVPAWERVKDDVRLFIVEVPLLSELGDAGAADAARATIEATPAPGALTYLLTGAPVDLSRD